MATANFADVSVMRSAKSGLANPRIEAEVADQLLRALEAADIADGCHQSTRYGKVDAGDREQPPDRGIIHCVFGDLPIENRKVVAEPVEFAYMPLDGNLLILWHRLALKPVPSSTVEQVGVRAFRDQVGVKNGMDLVLDPGPMPHDLVAPRHEPAHPLGCGIRRPDLRQVARGV